MKEVRTGRVARRQASKTRTFQPAYLKNEAISCTSLLIQKFFPYHSPLKNHLERASLCRWKLIDESFSSEEKEKKK